MTVENFVGSQLYVARTFRGYSQTQLAKLIETVPSFICEIENCRKTPSRELLERIYSVLGFAPTFFCRETEDILEDHQCSFRHRATTPQGLKKRVLAYGTLFMTLVHRLRSLVELPTYNLPRIQVGSTEDIEQAAQTCRERLGMGSSPVGEMTRVLENSGVVVTLFSVPTLKIDAFSRRGPVSIVVRNPSKNSTSRALFDMAHELGHLVIHPDGAGSSEEEAEADRFASAFLLPRSGFIPDFTAVRNPQWIHLFEMKRNWRASVAAIIRRARDLGLIDEGEYKRRCSYLRMKGWHKGEPCEPAEETPETLRAALDCYESESGFTLRDIGKQLGWTPETTEEIAGIPLPKDNEPRDRGLRIVVPRHGKHEGGEAGE